MSKDRERYYQSIASRLFSFRGSPFVLSSREMEIVEVWEADGIPLATVLEGMRQGYEAFRRGGARKGRKLTLVLCHPHVLKAYALLCDRGVGRGTQKVTQEDKCRAIGDAVEAFLAELPTPVQDLRDVFAGMRKELSREPCDPERLERLDESIEEQLFHMASQADLARLDREIRDEHGIKDREERSRLVRIKWVKSLRVRYGIPHVSPFYY